MTVVVLELLTAIDNTQRVREGLEVPLFLSLHRKGHGCDVKELFKVINSASTDSATADLFPTFQLTGYRCDTHKVASAPI